MKKGRQLLRPGKIYELGPASLLTSNIFQKGHRIRVQISGSFFPQLLAQLTERRTGKRLGKTAESHDFHLQ